MNKNNRPYPTVTVGYGRFLVLYERKFAYRVPLSLLVHLTEFYKQCAPFKHNRTL